MIINKINKSKRMDLHLLTKFYFKCYYIYQLLHYGHLETPTSFQYFLVIVGATFLPIKIEMILCPF